MTRNAPSSCGRRALDAHGAVYNMTPCSWGTQQQGLQPWLPLIFRHLILHRTTTIATRLQRVLDPLHTSKSVHEGCSHSHSGRCQQCDCRLVGADLILVYVVVATLDVTISCASVMDSDISQAERDIKWQRNFKRLSMMTQETSISDVSFTGYTDSFASKLLHQLPLRLLISALSVWGVMDRRTGDDRSQGTCQTTSRTHANTC